MRFVLTGFVFALSFIATGCGDSHGGLPEADYERAKSALESALTAWKNGESARKWAAKNMPVQFIDHAWFKKNTLLEYEIVEIRANGEKAPEAIVRLKIRSPKGAESEREALYGIELKNANHVSIGRDPMY